MSDIAGIFYLNGRPVDPVDLTRMITFDTCWSTDDSGIWIEGSIGLAHRMHYVTSESLHERYPINHDGRIILTADARIDNRIDLISQLGYQYHSPENITDAELIIGSYEKWGERCPEYLIGDYAFVIWDKRLRKLFVTRDAMGVKPFFYLYTQKYFIFGSSIQALLQIPEVPRKLNKLRLAYYLNSIEDDNEVTFYQDIFKLKPAYCMSIDVKCRRIWQYWDPVSNPKIRFRSDEEYEEALREIFFEAVRCRLRSSLPVGTFLSGGLDSTSVTCTARSIMEHDNRLPLHTFSAIFPDIADIDPRIDERYYINKVAELPGLHHHNVICDKISPLLDITWNNDEPMSHANLYLRWSIAKTAVQQGVRVLLTGTDGDTAVTYGYDYFQELIIKLRWIKMAREARALSQVAGGPFKGIIIHCGLKPLVPESIKRFWRYLRKRDNLSAFQIRNLNPEFSKYIDYRDHLQRLSDQRYNWYLPWNNHKHQILNSMAGFMDSYHQIRNKIVIDFRHPFFDRRVIAFCTAIPLSQKLQNGITRSIMRRAMRGVIPEEIQFRMNKSWLSSCFNTNFLRYEKETIECLLISYSYLLEEYIDTKVLFADFLTYSLCPLKNGNIASNLFSVISLVSWLHETGLS